MSKTRLSLADIEEYSDKNKPTTWDTMVKTLFSTFGKNVPYAEIGTSFLSTIAVLVYCCGGELFLLFFKLVHIRNIMSRL